MHGDLIGANERVFSGDHRGASPAQIRALVYDWEGLYHLHNYIPLIHPNVVIDPRDELFWQELYDVARHGVNNDICVIPRRLPLEPLRVAVRFMRIRNVHLLDGEMRETIETCCLAMMCWKWIGQRNADYGIDENDPDVSRFRTKMTLLIMNLFEFAKSCTDEEFEKWLRKPDDQKEIRASCTTDIPNKPTDA
ncbi:hypothetical protein F4821DRAFT_276318 [Hypoxylon rubiginosum]|uniref:Uncharacterized protein n=1 Tax=Hypoxylon rubiginosum TaxID=110542 RepID=A0ACC0D8S2_9PEZI|nr:hypothetical protein F4821DRAFT_276318 [Hypoxylon rubiginosum]